MVLRRQISSVHMWMAPRATVFWRIDGFGRLLPYREPHRSQNICQLHAIPHGLTITRNKNAIVRGALNAFRDVMYYIWHGY